MPSLSAALCTSAVVVAVVEQLPEAQTGVSLDLAGAEAVQAVERDVLGPVFLHQRHHGAVL